MKGKLLFVFILFSLCLFGQTDDTLNKFAKTTFFQTFTLKTGQTSEVQSISLQGDEVAQLNGELTCRGGCQITLGNVQFKADEFYFHPDTGEAEARYNVRIKALPAGTSAPRRH